MKYLFVLGRNVKLSVEEVRSFLEKEGFDFEEILLVDNGFLVDVNGKLKEGVVEKFGGVISIGEVLAEGNFKDIVNDLEKIDLYSGESNKLNYIVYDFEGEVFSEICDYLKKRFKEEKLKATEKKLTGKMKLQEGISVPSVSSSLLNEQYFVIGNYFGKILESVDYSELENRDMEKPIRRSELSISPRLAKILINLSGAKKDSVLLDPFCGIGVVLQEALLQKMKVIGIDKDKNAIKNAKINLEWFGFDKKEYVLLNGDSSKLNVSNVDCVATEPYLGELKRKQPSLDSARKMIQEYENLIIRVLKNLKKKVEGRIAFTSPFILTGKKRISCNFQRICSATGLKLVFEPIEEYRRRQVVGRKIAVLE